MGDFNQILNPAESSSEGTRVTPGMSEFRDCLQTSGIGDLPFQGPSFTWWNSQESNPLAKKLDRILVNDEWNLKYPHSHCIFDAMSFSDHRAAKLSWSQVKENRTSFKVSNHLLNHPCFMHTLAAFWESTHVVGTAMYSLTKKLKLLKPILKSFNRRYFSDLEVRVQEAHRSLIQAQAAFLQQPCTRTATVQKHKYNKWWHLIEAEEKFLKQRAHIKWFKDGDRNSAFFHRSIQARKSWNRIHYLMNQGVKLEEKQDLADHATEFFSALLGTPQQPLSQVLKSRIRELTKFKCAPWMKDMLQMDFSHQEIQNEVFALPKQKCPGPDGFNAEFFIRSWPIIGYDFSCAVQEFFDSGELLKQINATSIVLIPKAQGADCLANFRPISLCNVIYKVISKLLNRRLQVTLQHFISAAQTAFVKGRSLIENVALATELVKGFGSKNTPSRGALKVDLTKAFDSVRWDFILQILHAAEFPPCFINWIQQCISTTAFSVILNGEPCGFFQGTRGLRQGDPLSPSLFLLAMEIFGESLKVGFQNGDIIQHDLCGRPLITHLSFADDILIFFDGKTKSLEGIKKVFSGFKDIAGLQINMQKTILYQTGVPLLEQETATNLGFITGKLPVRYLGLPLLTKQMKKSDFDPLLDSITRRLSSWTVRPLSHAGRLQLITSVIYSVTNFWMGAFRLPKGCLRRITQLCSQFLWKGHMTGRYIPKIAWKSVCLPKAEGGLGLRDFISWNTTIQLRMIWALFSKKDSLWVAWVKNHWLKKQVLWTAPTTTTSSWVWRSLLSLRPLAKKLLFCKLGNGEIASFWHDKWHPSGPLIDYTGKDGPRRMGIHTQLTVFEACSRNHWRSSYNSRCHQIAEVRRIIDQTSTILQPSRVDTFLWGNDLNRTSQFSNKRTWEMLRPRNVIQTWAALVWFKEAVPRQAFHFWITTHNRLPLRSRLSMWGLNVLDICCICSSFSETREHLFLECEFVLQIWDWLGTKLGCSCRFFSWNRLLEWLAASPSKKLKMIRSIATQTIIHLIWQERNVRYHKSTSTTASSIILVADRSIRNTLLALKTKRRKDNLLSIWFRIV